MKKILFITLLMLFTVSISAQTTQQSEDTLSMEMSLDSSCVITVKANVKLGKNAAGVKNTDILMVFDKSVSTSQAINDLFSDLGR